MRRAARDAGTKTPLGVRLDEQARSAGFGTWGALLRSDPAVTPYDCDAPGHWDGQGAACMRSTMFSGNEADLLRLCVHQLAADVRGLRFPTMAGLPDGFEALGTQVRLSSWVVAGPSWYARIPWKGEFDNDVFENEITLSRQISTMLADATRDTYSHLGWLVDRPAMRRVFTGATTMVDVRAGRVHRVAVRLNQHGGVVWEARLDVGYQVIISIEENLPYVQGDDLATAEAMIATAAIGGHADPRDLGLIPFASVRKRQDGEPFAYKVRQGDLGRLAGIACRMADANPIPWPLGTVQTAA